ncbi:LysR family transcriptional regulator [Sphingomonas sp. S2-65]|uniref:LysR family transcriptional regulator n=1 Tax=Sphingomonas sp. S2-65 TaxID=2903960 RepID=UPI001F1ED3EC|nr:LysR family transcriptional regulator [Sphingomonas sp. S2-65]UYY58057.1 LysR family transcriptional regulator [Sphingomonas sp. S2-65]
MSISWDDLKLFLEIARAGTLTSAATRLKLSQPTAGRRLRALESSVGAALFQRTSSGFRLTDEGEAMLLHAEQMAEEALALERKVAGGARGIEGVVRMSASDWVSSRILAEPLATLAIAQPGLTVEIVADSRLLDLQRREADLAFRFVPFSGSDIIHRRFRRIRYGLYASPAYIDRCGDPLSSSSGEGHRLVTMDSALDRLVDVTWLRARWPSAALTFRSNNREAQGAACAAGAGLAVLPRVIGDNLPLEQLGGEEPPARDLWLGYHEDLRRLRRLRRLVEHLDEVLPADL